MSIDLVKFYSINDLLSRVALFFFSKETMMAYIIRKILLFSFCSFLIAKKIPISSFLTKSIIYYRSNFLYFFLFHFSKERQTGIVTTNTTITTNLKTTATTTTTQTTPHHHDYPQHHHCEVDNYAASRVC